MNINIDWLVVTIITALAIVAGFLLKQTLKTVQTQIAEIVKTLQDILTELAGSRVQSERYKSDINELYDVTRRQHERIDKIKETADWIYSAQSNCPYNPFAKSIPKET